MKNKPTQPMAKAPKENHASANLVIDIIVEGKVDKGGINRVPPSSPRPPAPSGQGGAGVAKNQAKSTGA